MIYLVKELQKYYKKVNNKLLFKNGMSLNQLAVEMWAKLGNEGIDSSILSKVIHGERIFTSKQLKVFCEILNLSHIEVYSLENELGKDLLQKHLGVVVPISDCDELIADKSMKDFVLKRVKILRESGSMQEALQMTSFFQSALSFTPKVRQGNLSFLGHLLNEKVRCLIYLEKPDTLLKHSQKINEEALEIGNQLNDLEIIRMAHGNFGGSLYVAKQYGRSADYLKKTMHLMDSETKVEYVRTQLNNYGFMKMDSEYRDTYKQAEKILSSPEEHNPSFIASMYEAIGRSMSFMGSSLEAKNFLTDIDTTGLETYFQSQLIRGKMFISHRNFLKSEIVDLDEIKELFLLAKAPQFSLFKRHQQQIESMYKEMIHE